MERRGIDVFSLVQIHHEFRPVFWRRFRLSFIAGLVLYAASSSLPHAHAGQDSDCVKICEGLVEFSGPSYGNLSAANLVNRSSADGGNSKGSTRQANVSAKGFDSAGNPSGRWSPEHDQYCANHGFITDETVRPQWGPLIPENPTQPDFTPSAAKGAAGCKYAGVEQGDDNCAVLTKKIERCSLQKGQLVKMCAAYATAADGLAWQYVLAALDVGVTAICGYQCIQGESASATNDTACTVAACAAGLAEGVATLYVAGKSDATQKESTASGWEYLLGGVGAVSGLAKCGTGIKGHLGKNWTTPDEAPATGQGR